MAKIDYNKVKKMYLKGKTVPEIARTLKCSPGTLHNNRDKWFEERPQVEEVKVAPAPSPPPEENLPVHQVEPSTLQPTKEEKEFITVKNFYKAQMKKVREKIKVLTIMGLEYEENGEDVFKELQLLEKLLKILQSAQQIDYKTHDIMSYKDMVELDLNIKKMELEIVKVRQGAE